MRIWGLTVTQCESQLGRPSVLGHLKGTGGGKTLLLNAHVDTVGVEGMAEPFSGAIQDGNLYGRGAYDMKGSLAACITAVKALSKGGPSLKGDVIIAAVADEEYASLGTQDILSHYQKTGFKIDGAIVTEPTELEICLAHKGFIWLEVETFGRAAHGSRFDLGLDANIRMGRFLAELDKLEQDLRQREPHALVGPPSLHAATLQGGTGLSAYADHCLLGLERRTIPGETLNQVQNEIQAILEKLAREDERFVGTCKILLERPPFEVSPQAAIVQAVGQATQSVLGQGPVYGGQTPWMDSAFLAQAGIETVVIGPAGAGAHAVEEWVDLESVAQLAQILAQTAEAYC